jgi:hypothetical protein
MNLTCHHCGQRPERWLPVEPFHDLSAVARLLNTSPGYLRKWICTEPYLRAFPQVYRKTWDKSLRRLIPESMLWKMLAWRARRYL